MTFSPATSGFRRGLGGLPIWLALTGIGCREPIVYEPPPPVAYLHEKQTMTPEQTARQFYEAVLRKKAYREFLDLASKRMIQRGPDKASLKRILARKSYPDVSKARLTQEGEDRSRVELDAGGETYVFDLVRENLRWRVDRFDPAPLDWEIPGLEAPLQPAP